MAKGYIQQFWKLMYSALGLIFRRPIPGTSIVPIMADGRIVLIKRRDTNQWALPGGIVDWGEDIYSTVCREMEEETGLQVTQIRRLVGVYSSPHRDPRFHSVCMVVEADVDGSFDVQDTLEISDIRAFTPEDIPLDNLSHDHGQQLKDYFSGATTLA